MLLTVVAFLRCAFIHICTLSLLLYCSSDLSDCALSAFYYKCVVSYFFYLKSVNFIFAKYILCCVCEKRILLFEKMVFDFGVLCLPGTADVVIR